jgi:ATP-dependent helicase/nuclease subunit A
MNSLNPQLHKPLKILQASAGSGKTYSLTAHYLTLLFTHPYKYREILAVTFTNKATEEMKSRILEVLQGLARGDKEMQSFQELILHAHPHLDQYKVQIEAHEIYRRILHDYSRFSVNTIDAFIQKVIRSFAFELGLDAGYKLEMNTEKVKRELANKLNEQLDKNPALLQWMINMALELVKDDKSWNYRNTLLNLANEIFKERYQPFEEALKKLDLNTLFTDLQSATKAIITYFEETLIEQAQHALRIFKESGINLNELKGRSKSPLNNLEKVAWGDFIKVKGLSKLIDNPEEWQKGNLSAAVDNLYQQLNPLLKAIVSFFNEQVSQYGMAKAVDANLYYLHLMQEMAGLLTDYRVENHLLISSDAQTLLRGITQDQQDNPSFIWEKMGNRYRHFLFDEFQDTSSFQWRNFLPLLKNAIATPSGNTSDNLIVGDVKQSIYRWRNGDWRILLNQAAADIGEQHILKDSLAENYRSAANIIDFNNFLFYYAPRILQESINNTVLADGGDDLFDNWWSAQGLDRIITDAYKESFQEKPAKAPAGGSIEISFLSVTTNNHRNTATREDALKNLADTLHQWLTGEEQRFKPGQICVLVRSNRQAREVIEYLMKDQQERISYANQHNHFYKQYVILSGEALLIANNSAIKLLLNTLKWMVSKQDQASVFKATCIQLYNQFQNKEVDTSAWLKIPLAKPQDLAGLLPDELCNKWREWQQVPLFVLIENLINAYQLGKQEADLPYLFAFRDMVSEFIQQGERGISQFLLWWADEGIKKALPSSEKTDAVQVMTIHKSKGLAFDVVMLPLCDWDLDGQSNSIFWVPTQGTPYAMLNTVPVNYTKKLGQSAFAQAYFEELLFNYMDALNMLYVATTRTRQYLYINAPAYASGKEEKLSLAGDLIYQSLNSIQVSNSSGIRAFNEEFIVGKLFIDEKVERKEQNEQNENEHIINTHTWSFTHYPLSNRVNDALTDKKVWEKLDLLSGNTSQRMGVILHDLLAQVTDMNDLPDKLAEMQQNGLFRAIEKENILEIAVSVLEQPELKNLLNKPYKNLNEQTIIDGNGESYRPDKVLIGEDEVIIIDFKFTGEPKPAHQKQLASYYKLLAAMGHQNIKAYLYYGYLKELTPLSQLF